MLCYCHHLCLWCRDVFTRGLSFGRDEQSTFSMDPSYVIRHLKVFNILEING